MERERNRGAAPFFAHPPTDFSEHSRAALRHAKALAALFDGATVDLFHVIEETLHPAFYGPTVQSIYDAQPDIGERVTVHLEEFYRTTEGPGGDVSFAAAPGRAPQAIAEQAASTGAGLIVMATHGRTGLERFALGSVAEKVVRTAPCPVFVAKSFGKRLVTPPKPTEEAADVPNVFPHPAARASE